MTPTLGGTIDSGFFSQYDATVQQGLATGAYVIVDLVSTYIGDHFLYISYTFTAQLCPMERWNHQPRWTNYCPIRKHLVPVGRKVCQPTQDHRESFVLRVTFVTNYDLVRYHERAP